MILILYIKNCADIKIELNILNSLVVGNNIENDFEAFIQKYPEVLKCIPILFTKREMDIYCMYPEGAYNYNIRKMNYPISQYKYFMKGTGLFELLCMKLINNVVDYVIGFEEWLNPNCRKNRGGHLKEDLVESFIVKADYVKEVNYFKEMYLSDLEAKTSLNLSSLSNEGKTEKRFNYVIITPNGSKLNETARSYKTLVLESKNIDRFKFVWITDGLGWVSAKNNLK